MRSMSIVLIILVAGCGKSTSNKKTVVPFDEVPPVVLKAAENRMPEVKFDNVWKTPKGIYEVRGKTKKGKAIEVEVSESGEVLAVE